MKFLETEIPEVVLIEPTVHRDPRGFFLESWHAGKYAEGGVAATFVQDNHSRSGPGILRGLHAQRARPQGKLVRVLSGEVYDVAVDVRRGSPSFGRYVAVRISGENFRQLWVPPGFLHGFAVTSDGAEFEYKCTTPYDPDDEYGVVWNDPDLAIPWPLEEPIVSDRDRDLPRLSEIEHLLPTYTPR